MDPRRGKLARAALAMSSVVVLATPALAAADEPDLSEVRIELSDLPQGFRLVPDAELVDVGGSAKQVGEALERALEVASLHQYQVFASGAGDELIELVLVGPLIEPERIGMSRELADGETLAASLAPPLTLSVEQSDPRLIDTTGIGEVSAGFVIESTVSSDLVTVTNILGVPWTEATTQFLLAIRGNYVIVMMTQHVGSGSPDVDFLAAASHVDGHLAAALGLTPPGTYRPGGTFSPSVANNIPTLGDISTEPSVAFANLVLTAIAVIALTIGMRLLNSTLVRHEDALEQLVRPARALGRWWAAADDVLARRLGAVAALVRVLGVLLFYGVLFSFLEDGWRPWTVSGLFLLGVMTIAFGAVGTTDDLVELRAAHRWGLPARLAVKPALVLFAAGSVALTKVAHLVPGLMIGTPEAFSLEDEVGERDELRLASVGLVTTAAVGLGAWAIATPLDAVLDGSGGALQSVVAAIVTLLVLVFAVAVENLFANLVALPGSEGATLRRHHRAVWRVSMIAITALFFHTLINPRGDLARSLESTNVRVALATVATFLIFTAGVHLWFRRIDRRVPARLAAEPPPAPAAEAELTPPLPPTPPTERTPGGAVAPMVAVLRAERPRRRRDPVFVVKATTAAVTLLGLVSLVSVVVVQHQRDTRRFDTAHTAYLAGECTVAIAGYDELLADGRLLDTAGVEGPATRERDDCRQLVAIDAVSDTDPAGALAQYADFVSEHPDSVLTPSVGGRVTALVASADGSAVASEANCDHLDAYAAAGVVRAEDVAGVRVWCAKTYEGAGRAGDAYATALVVLQSDAVAPSTLLAAEDVALRNPAACADVERLLGLTSLRDSEERLAGFLQQCMTTAAAADNAAGLADVQIAFLAQFPDHPDAPAVELALTDNYAACDHLEVLRSSANIAGRPGFIPTITLTCAHTAEFFQDYATAIERYQWFLDNAPGDERVVEARDGLARSLIADAQLQGAGSLPQPVDTGGSGTGRTTIAIFNDSPEELRIVMSGPESRIEILAASPTSSEYLGVGPPSCRTDVPRLDLKVQDGDYQVLVESTGGGVSPFVGTWSLGRGDAYRSCFFVVTAIG